MDRSLFASCIGSATQIMGTTAGLINMHHAHAKRVVLEAAVELYDMAEREIAQREAAEKVLVSAEFAQHAAERAEVDRASSEEVPAGH